MNEYEARQYIKDNKSILFDKFANLEVVPPSEVPSTIFMAGSAGAGKTETSKWFLEQLTKDENPAYLSRIDADEIKELIPGYNGKNSDVYQNAAALGVQKLIDYTIKHGQPALVDGTFSEYNICKNNIERCIGHNRQVGIIYIYQDPIRAYELTLARGIKDGRFVSKEFFIESLFRSKENAERIKKEFGKKVNLNVIIKNFEGEFKKIHLNVDNIDSYTKIEYDSVSLLKVLQCIDEANNED